MRLSLSLTRHLARARQKSCPAKGVTMTNTRELASVTPQEWEQRKWLGSLSRLSEGQGSMISRAPEAKECRESYLVGMCRVIN